MNLRFENIFPPCYLSLGGLCLTSRYPEGRSSLSFFVCFFGGGGLNFSEPSKRGLAS
jgi:hypothetical protein